MFAIQKEAFNRKKTSTSIEASETSANLNAQNLPIQRKAACACGGDCPKCQSNLANLPISQPTDASEIEADRIADQVMRGSDNQKSSAQTASVPELPGSSPVIQAKGGNDKKSGSQPGGKIDSSQSGGNALDAGTQTFMQDRFGTDFSGVRIHTDREAEQMSAALGAKAFTVGSDIYFNDGQYQPQTE